MRPEITIAGLIALFVAIAIVMAAITYRNERREATSYDNDDEIFQRAPAWGKRLNEKLNGVLARLSSLKQQVGIEAWADEKRDRQTMATQEEVLAKVSEATTVSKSVNILVKEAIALLKQGQSDPAKNAEAIALLEAGIADDNAVLVENTPEEPAA